MRSNLSGKTALVTGGSRGIGRAICRSLASCGAHVFVNFRSGEQEAQQTVALCEEAGGSGEPIAFDISDVDQVKEGIEQIKKSGKPIDILVNNAGISLDGLLVRMKDEDWQRTLQVNLTGAFSVSRAVAKMMMKAKQGRIIQISSVVGEMGNIGQAPYVASKAGLIGLTKAMARELASRNITVNAITPGFIETEMTDALDEGLKEEHLKNIPLGRYGSADEIGALTAFLASQEAGYITGQVIGVNGGMYM